MSENKTLKQEGGFKAGWSKFMSLNGSAVFLGMIAVIIIFEIYLQITRGGGGLLFITPSNLLGILRQQYYLGIIAFGLTLVMMILPTVINISASSIRAVPDSLRSASLALGASKIQTIFKVVIPAAKSGIMTGVVLGIGRALGEAMAINMVAGGAVNIPLPFHSVRFLTTQLVSEMSYSSGLHRQVLFTVGLVLYVFIVFINLLLTFIKKKGERAA